MRIAIDFDGTICRRRGFPRKNSFSSDPPMKGAVAALHWFIKQGHEPYILTARKEGEFPKITAWLTKHHFPTLEVTNVKKNGTLALIDDRAIRFTNWLDITKYFE